MHIIIYNIYIYISHKKNMNIKCFNNTYLDAYMYIKYIIKNNIAINSNKY